MSHSIGSPSDRNSISILLLWEPANEYIVFSSIINIRNWQDCLKVLAVTSATFQSQLMVNVPISMCTAQLQARSDLCFFSLIKSLNFAAASGTSIETVFYVTLSRLKVTGVKR